MNITSKGVTLTESMEELVSERVAHLASHAPTLDNVRCHIIYHDSYQEFECELFVHHEKKELFAKERGTDFKQTLSHTCAAMAHQLEKQKTQHSKKHQNHNAINVEK
ncbi:Sigma 54 modulation protein / S30EA ribosomal protein [Vibrio mediterranei]|uniref:HPF/RaiA family ribosome-associated protein n=1 Tax=Vibrio mediterranei TaxID=689 RepID=UPI00078388F4|nr:HPF/RaiA family ribosome-associated protein [Vibrio mediterranei]SBO09151.1 Sigma 54 modulation protein / S30EA ribosomal protein [Vibrio mediterranei]